MHVGTGVAPGVRPGVAPGVVPGVVPGVSPGGVAGKLCEDLGLWGHETMQVLTGPAPTFLNPVLSPQE